MFFSNYIHLMYFVKKTKENLDDNFKLHTEVQLKKKKSINTVFCIHFKIFMMTPLSVMHRETYVFGQPL